MNEQGWHNGESTHSAKPDFPEKNLSEQEREPTKNLMALTQGLKTRPHWWEGGLLTTGIIACTGALIGEVEEEKSGGALRAF